MNDDQAHPAPSPGSVSDIFGLIRSGAASSRASIAKATGLAPSTISLRVEALRAIGLITESGDEESRGGRRARRLSVDASAGRVLAIDLGEDGADYTVSDLAGDRLLTASAATGLDPDPADFIRRLWAEISGRMTESSIDPTSLRAIAIGVPAPVARPSSRIVSPGFMPTWHEADLPALLGSLTGVPVTIENDANLIAVAENGGADRGTAPDLIAFKLDARLGAGLIVDGHLHRGAGGAAGEIGHPAVDGIASISCFCGVANCVDATASGRALVAKLAAQGHPFSTTSEMVDAARFNDFEVVDALRHAGVQIGSVLSALVNFINPATVVLGGVLSTSAPFVAALRAELFRLCLPVITQDLEIRAVEDPADAQLRGAVQLALQEAMSPRRIEHLVGQTA